MTVSVLLCGFASAQQQTRTAGPHDPGPRRGTQDAGGPLPGLDAAERNLFIAARNRFRAVDSVSGGIADAARGVINGSGLGPTYNANSCAACHSQPAIGGSSPAENPQVALAHLDGAHNIVPPFVTHFGPIREARFITNPDGSPDGGVHDLYVIAGRRDAPGCSMAQPDFARAIREHNIAYRIPTPVYGEGLVENTSDRRLESDAAQLAARRRIDGISGNFNHSGNDGTITRYGWKAQNKSLLMFAGEAYNVEVGTTNELFPNERDDVPGCRFNRLPEDATNLRALGFSNSPASDMSSDIVNFAAFMRLSAAPTPASPTVSTTRGRRAFDNVGCNLCHIVSHRTSRSIFTGQSNVDYFPYSDFELHDMGAGLRDRITQGQATGDQFRTAPLWGVGQRLYFLHDGRTDDLLRAIEAHRSDGSEANTVIGNFNALPAAAQQDILDFLRSL